MEKDLETKPQVKTENPLLTRLSRLPGTTVRLPSKGIFYTHGELDDEVVNGEVVVYQMTATDELMLRSVDMLYQGTAIDTVFKRCIPQIKQPMQLLINDVDYLLTILRKISYGLHIPIRYMCDCVKDESEKEKIHAAGEDQYLIPIDHFLSKSKELNPKNFNKEFKVTLENEQVVTIQPIRFADFIAINQVNDDDFEDVEFIREYVARNLTAITLSVDEITDKEMIKEWYKALPRLDSERIQRKVEEMTPWGIDFKYEITCHQCKEKRELTHHLNPVHFFTLPSSPEKLKY